MEYGETLVEIMAKCYQPPIMWSQNWAEKVVLISEKL